jgi:hypothetical protein
VATVNDKIIGIAWYRRQDYPTIRKIMEDAHVLPESYDAWSRLVKGVVQLEEANGTRIVKAIIVPQDFIGWCVIRRRSANANARTRFVNEVVAAVLAKEASGPERPAPERKLVKTRRTGIAHILSGALAVGT